MIRGWTLLVALGAALVSSAGPAAAALPPVAGGPIPTDQERPSTVTTAAVDELLELSGLQVQLEAVSAGIRAQFRGREGRLSAQDRATIDRIAARHFGPEVLYARIRLELGRSLEAATLEEALAWYRSPLGRRITRVELAALIPGAEREMSLPSDERIALVQRLDESGGASETTLDLAMALVRSLVRAADPFRPEPTRVGSAALESLIARTRTEALAPIKMACLLNMLFAYDELHDAELAEYVRFVESRAGRWYMTTMNNALVSAVSMAAELAAVELVTLVPQLSGDLR